MLPIVMDDDDILVKTLIALIVLLSSSIGIYSSVIDGVK